MINKMLKIDDLDVLIFDFDGVLTNNKVFTDNNGKEFVSCSRADGLGFDALRKIKKPTYILSTEKNSVVTARAKKLKIPVLQGVTDKWKTLQELATKESFSVHKALYVGNDLNDFFPIQNCGYSACPADSHQKISDIATIKLRTLGGEGVVRELLEDVFQLDLIKILYTNKE